jgi:hypothetical protein
MSEEVLLVAFRRESDALGTLGQDREQVAFRTRRRAQSNRNCMHSHQNGSRKWLNANWNLCCAKMGKRFEASGSGRDVMAGKKLR